MLHADALTIAQEWVDALKGDCLRIEIVGSVRRGVAEVKDIELVCIPEPRRPSAEFGVKVFNTLLDKSLYFLEKNSCLEMIKGGDKYKQFWILKEGGVHVIKLDLFLVTPPAQWGVLMVIRTGPAEFSRWCVTHESKGGALPDGYCVAQGAVWRVDQVDVKGVPFEGESPKSMPEEEDFLNFLNILRQEPRERVARWER